MRVLVVDAANVVGSVPDGWWRDRAGAARRLHERLAAAQLGYHLVVFVLEGKARAGVPAGLRGTLLTVHAPGPGDDEIAAQCRAHASADQVTLVTADQELLARVAGPGPRPWGRALFGTPFQRQPTTPRAATTIDTGR